jgi:phospholipase C
MATRRDFLRLMGAGAGAAMLPATIRKALAIPANRKTGTIQDVEHVVILMQENRSFDHYFGSMRGVRGFGDPRPARQRNGKTVWYQPPAEVETDRYHDRGLPKGEEHVLPFYINPPETTEFIAGTDHGWSSGHLSFNHGHWDKWVTHKQDVMTMGYLKREDVSYHYALADAFTICDAYHCSVHGNTAMNRPFLWSGTMDASNTRGKKKNGPGFGERHHVNGFTWTTYPERLEEAGISWKLYQGGTGEPGTPTDNYTDNSLEFFAAYHVQEGADPNGPLVQKGVTDRTLKQFKEDIVAGKLAQVNWLVAPYIYSEHPEASARDGAYYVNLVMEALTANPEVWSKTVFLINYDENDGLFDHIIPPMPPMGNVPNHAGLVSPDLADCLYGPEPDEFINMDDYPGERRPVVPGADPGGLQPIGLGPRVPMLVISPWSRGGYVCSETFDHTSVIRFLEARFGVHDPNISAWRRSICGDLTSALDFAGAHDAEPQKFVVPAVLKSEKKPYTVATPQVMPQQEPGTRPARALPYALRVECHVDRNTRRLVVEFKNDGKTGAALAVRNGLQMEEGPRRYSISAEQAVTDYWLISSNRGDDDEDDNGKPKKHVAPRHDPDFDLEMHGPNGWYAQMRGAIARAHEAVPEVAVQYDHASGNVALKLTNMGTAPCSLQIAQGYAKDAGRTVALAAGDAKVEHWDLSESHGWFDLTVTHEGAPLFLRRFAGHVETGKASMSDPLLRG